MAVKVDDLADAIIDALAEYSDEVAEAVKEEVEKAAKECVANLKKTSPERTGDYKKGWKAKVVHEDKGNIRITVHNSKRPELTTWLEYGYEKRNGGRVQAYPHIKAAEEKAKKNLSKRIEEVLK